MGNIFERRRLQIFSRQIPLLVSAVSSALAVHKAKNSTNDEIIRAHVSKFLSNPMHFHDGNFITTIQSELDNAQKSGDISAALSWGRAYYLLTRRIGHAELGFFNLAMESNVLERPLAFGSLESTENSFIPKNIVQFWDKKSPPDDVWSLMKDIKERNGGWNYFLFDEEAAAAFILENFGVNAYYAFNSVPHVASKSDLFRLCWIYVNGGIYIDADERQIAPLEQILKPECLLILSWSKGSPPCINNNIFACAERHPFIESVLNILFEHIEAQYIGRFQTNPWVLTGPGAFTMALLDDLSVYGISTLMNYAAIISDAELQKILKTEIALDYRSSALGNWRL